MQKKSKQKKLIIFDFFKIIKKNKIKMKFGRSVKILRVLRKKYETLNSNGQLIRYLDKEWWWYEITI